MSAFNPRFMAMVKRRADEATAAHAKAALLTPLTAAEAALTSVQAYQNSGKMSVKVAQADIRTAISPLERQALLNRLSRGQ